MSQTDDHPWRTEPASAPVEVLWRPGAGRRQPGRGARIVVGVAVLGAVARVLVTPRRWVAPGNRSAVV